MCEDTIEEIVTEGLEFDVLFQSWLKRNEVLGFYFTAKDISPSFDDATNDNDNKLQFYVIKGWVKKLKEMKEVKSVWVLVVSIFVNVEDEHSFHKVVKITEVNLAEFI
jgi:hypothetical protein